MALPIIKYPTYTLTIPSTGEVVNFRPFTVEDEKLLLTAEESKEISEMISASKAVIKNCVENIDTEALTVYDVDYIFLQLRIKSVSSISELFYRVQECSQNDGEPCEKTIKLSINLDHVGIKKFDKESGQYIPYTPENKVAGGFKVALSNTIGVIMKHPGFREKDAYYKMESPVMDDLVKLCVVSVYDETTVYTRDEFSAEELDKFYNSLTSSNRDTLLQFISDIPEMRYETDLVCKTCGYTEKLIYSSLDDFFD